MPYPRKSRAAKKNPIYHVMIYGNAIVQKSAKRQINQKNGKSLKKK